MIVEKLMAFYNGVPDTNSHLFDSDNCMRGNWTPLCNRNLHVGPSVGVYGESEQSIFRFPALCEECKLVKTMLELAE